MVWHDGIGVQSDSETSGQIEDALSNPSSPMLEALVGDGFEPASKSAPNTPAPAMLGEVLLLREELAVSTVVARQG